MGTNYYLRRVKPREVYDEYHICKCSAGWKVHFQDSSEYKWKENAPSYHSTEDIKYLLSTGEYQLVNKYGDLTEPGAESLAAFHKLLKHEPDSDESRVTSDDYKDVNGYLFTPAEFC